VHDIVVNDPLTNDPPANHSVGDFIDAHEISGTSIGGTIPVHDFNNPTPTSTLGPGTGMTPAHVNTPPLYRGWGGGGTTRRVLFQQWHLNCPRPR
jgi:hypothetical protein